MPHARYRCGTPPLALISRLILVLALSGCSLEHRARIDASDDRADVPIAMTDALDAQLDALDAPADVPDAPDALVVDVADAPCLGTICNGVCRDLAADPNNCGACDRVCAV